ncbi:hypothetical protein IMZ48_26615 [Candidatus Bathyarchaeota archaeon]|nr:hypothetical protein [Candidatus Bathyarchaeota archaeon]
MSIPDGTPTGNDVAGTINIPVLARVCDDIRATILNYHPPGAWPHQQDLCGLISTFLADEEAPKMHVELDAIRSCRLDRLLEDILEPEHHPKKGEGGEIFPRLIKNTYKLQKKWKERFKGEYEKLDDIRCQEMKSMGRLHGLEFRLDGHPRWVTKKGASEGYVSSLEPGM